MYVLDVCMMKRETDTSFVSMAFLSIAHPWHGCCSLPIHEFGIDGGAERI